MVHPLYKYPFGSDTFDSFSVDELQKQASLLAEPGILHGKTGFSLFFFEYARYSGIPAYENVAIALLENATKTISYKTQLNYADGLCGIGCGIEYLVQSGYLDDDTDELLKDIDDLIIHEIHWQRMTDVSLMYGISGLGYYLYWRTRKSPYNTVNLCLKEYFIYLIDWLNQLVPFADKDKMEVLYLLSAIRLTGFYKSKVDKLIQSISVSSNTTPL